tara:strand:- start:558 stop:809 length:252 start_codon:yes stop_codon:yes gene_type:complete
MLVFDKQVSLKENAMKYEVIRSCIINGSGKKVGDHVDIEDNTIAENLMGISRIVPVAESVVLEDRSVAVTESSPKPKTRAKKK